MIHAFKKRGLEFKFKFWEYFLALPMAHLRNKPIDISFFLLQYIIATTVESPFAIPHEVLHTRYEIT